MSEIPCLLCEPDPEIVFYRGARVLGLWDAFPANGGRVLLVPKRHVPSWLDATREEQEELFSALTIAHKEVIARYQPRGYDIDIRDGLHLHVRLLPKAPAGAPLPDRVLDQPLSPTFGPTLVTGENDPLLPYLKPGTRASASGTRRDRPPSRSTTPATRPAPSPRPTVPGSAS